MTQTAANVAAGAPLVTGGILAGPIGTVLPTSETTSLNAAIKALGYAGESGIEPSGDAASLKDIKAWGGDIVTSVSEDKSTTKFKFTLIEVFNADVAEFVFGEDNVTTTAATTSAGTKLSIMDKGDDILPKVFVFDMKYEGKKMRIVAPNAKAIVTAELAFTDADITGYECELTCNKDASGVRTYRYLANDDLVPA